MAAQCAEAIPSTPWCSGMAANLGDDGAGSGGGLDAVALRHVSVVAVAVGGLCADGRRDVHLAVADLADLKAGHREGRCELLHLLTNLCNPGVSLNHPA